MLRLHNNDRYPIIFILFFMIVYSKNIIKIYDIVVGNRILYYYIYF